MGGSETTTIVDYPDYQKNPYINMLGLVADERAIAIIDSPYADYVPMAEEIENALFGLGYIISDFPSLYDMFGKFMAGLDVDALFDQIFADSTQGTIIDNLVSVHAGILSDDIEQETLPRFVTGLRDINSVMSSTFVAGKAMIEAQRVKEVSRFDAETRYKMIPFAVERWKTHLNWNENVIKRYLETMTFAASSMMSARNQDMTVDAKDVLWPLDTLVYEANAIGALTGAKVTTEPKNLVGGILGGAASGAAAGNQISPGGTGALYGAIIGGVLGLASSL